MNLDRFEDEASKAMGYARRGGVAEGARWRGNHRATVLAAMVVALGIAGWSALDSNGLDVDPEAHWTEKMATTRWVAYAPALATSVRSWETRPATIRDDLAILRRAGFTGLVTYIASGSLGTDLPSLAAEGGFDGLIIGIWDPHSAEELAAAKAAAQLPIVLGFCVGNEGLGQRYDLATLSAAIEALRTVTGKPVTTTEEISDYADERVMALGDWVFPNVHPFHNDLLEPDSAAQWTRSVFEDVVRRAGRFVLFKEVGLPSAGDEKGVLSEARQDTYYRHLEASNIQFAFFEAFDQPWKDHEAIEPHWGLFRSDRTPKRIAARLMRAHLARLNEADRTPDLEESASSARSVGDRVQ